MALEIVWLGKVSLRKQYLAKRDRSSTHLEKDFLMKETLRTKAFLENKFGAFQEIPIKLVVLSWAEQG